jgi:hypothetical protein
MGKEHERVSERVKWAEISDKDKVKLVIDHLFGWLTFDSSEAYYDELWKTGKLVHTPYPVALFDDDWEVFREEDKDADTFDPLHSMNSAWEIVEKLYERFDVRLSVDLDNMEKYYVQVWKQRCSDTMVGYGSSKESMPEAICKAALRACVTEIE